MRPMKLRIRTVTSVGRFCKSNNAGADATLTTPVVEERGQGRRLNWPRHRLTVSGFLSTMTPIID